MRAGGRETALIDVHIDAGNGQDSQSAWEALRAANSSRSGKRKRIFAIWWLGGGGEAVPSMV